MENKNVVLLTIFILLIAVISFKFTEITGEVVRGDITTISVYPTTVTAGSILSVNVKPGRDGVNQGLDIYRVDHNLRIDQNAVQACRRYKCMEASTVKYIVSDSFQSGEYYMRGYDRYTKNYVRAYFTVKAKYPPKGPKIHR